MYLKFFKHTLKETYYFLYCLVQQCMY